MWVKSKFLRILIYLLSPLCPTLVSRILYRAAFHRRLDLKHPKTLNEKTMWLKLRVYAKDPLVAKCADKLRVRDYVEEKGCGDALNELEAVWENPEQIEVNTAELLVQKNRHGPTGSIKMAWNPKYTLYTCVDQNNSNDG